MRQQEDLAEYDLIFLHVFAPVMLEYVSWVLKRAKECNLKRLYFLARDGWLMYHLAVFLKEHAKEEIDIDLRYIHVSRYVLRNSEYAFIGSECLDTICVGGIDITFEKIMKRAALSQEDILKVAKAVGFENRLDECLSYAQVQDLKTRLCSYGDEFLEIVKKSVSGFLETATGYLKQEGLLEDVSFAIVDSGWLGSTQKSLQRIISHIKGQDIQLKGFYFGLYELPGEMKQEAYEGYYLRPDKDIGRKTRFSICLFETLFSSPEGMTLGYQKISDGTYQVVQSEDTNPNTRFMSRNFELMMMFVKNLDMTWLENAKTGSEGQKLVEELLSLIMGNPVKEEAKTLGMLQFCDDVLESQMQWVAADWDYNELRKQSFFRKVLIKFFKSKEKLHESGWPEGSIVNLCGEGSKAYRALCSERLYKRLMYVRKAI